MVKSVLGVYHRGLCDWVLQRLTAIVMAMYTLVGVGYFLCHPALSYVQWHTLLAKPVIKVNVIFYLLAMLWHAWIGIWTITTDYLQCFILRAVLHVAVLGALIMYFIFAVSLMGSV